MRYIIIIFVSMLSSQDTQTDTSFESGGTKGSVGTVTINGQVYNQLSLRPEIPIGKLGVGLDIYLYFNDDGMYFESWDLSSGGAVYRTIIDKIYYLRWGQPGDNLYFMAGALPSVTLGHGILVNNYSNIMEYPQVRQVGLNLQAKIAGVEIEMIHSNFKSATPGVMGIRGSYSIKPKLSIGASFVTDLNQLAGLPDSDGDDYPDYYDLYPEDDTKYDDYLFWYETYFDIYESSPMWEFDKWYIESGFANVYDPSDADNDEISGFAIDVAYALNEKTALYSQVGFLIGEVKNTDYSGQDKELGWGLVPIGARTKLGPVNLLAEFRMGFERFVFNYWDRSYDVNRVSVGANGVVTRESQLFLYGKLNGFYTQANMGVMNLFNLGMGYQNMQGEKWDNILGVYKLGETNQMLLTTININPSLIPKVSKAEAFYQQSNIPDPFEFRPSASTIWGYNVGIEISAGVMLLYQVRTTYISDLDNVGEYSPIKSIQIETQFIF